MVAHSDVVFFFGLVVSVIFICDLYAPVPPVAETVTTAVPPLQAIGVVSTELATTAAGCETIIVVVEVHPFASVTV